MRGTRRILGVSICVRSTAMITRAQVARHILAHLNMEQSEAELVRWPERALTELLESDTDSPNDQVLLDVLTYLAAGDSDGFPLTWAVLSGLLGELGVTVQVVPRELLDLPA